MCINSEISGRDLFAKRGGKAFRDVMELINRITDYIFSKEENIRKELSEIMGGQVLELELDKLIKKGEQIGLERGETAVTNLVKN